MGLRQAAEWNSSVRDTLHTIQEAKSAKLAQCILVREPAKHRPQGKQAAACLAVICNQSTQCPCVTKSHAERMEEQAQGEKVILI